MQLPPAWTTNINDLPNFHENAQPTFTQGDEASHNRIVLKSKEESPLNPEFNPISENLRIATMDFNDEGDMHGKLKELMQRTGKETEASVRNSCKILIPMKKIYLIKKIHFYKFFLAADYAVKDSFVWATAQMASTIPPNDPDYRYQWGLTKVKGPDAWQILDSQTNNASAATKIVTVCVADSGTDVAHPDLMGRLDTKVGYNAIDKNQDISDALKHGTHVAGIVAAIDNNNLDIAGVGTDRVEILTCKFLNAQGYGYVSDAVACIDYCLENGADIITNSWSGSEDNPALRDAIQQSFDKDVLFVVAAGNTASNLDLEKAYPASYANEFSNMIVVASTNYQDKLSNFSNYGQDSVHIGAPGEW